MYRVRLTAEAHPLTDEELMGRARAGDVAAYETLVRRYQDVALRTASLVAPEADAADAVQDAFVKAYAALPRFRTGAPVRPWLLSIVANESRNRRRSATRRAELAVRAGSADAGAGERAVARGGGARRRASRDAVGGDRAAP